MPCKKHYSLTILVFICLFLAGCFTEENNERSQAHDFSQSQSQSYAHALKQYATVSTHLLTQNESWQEGLVPDGDFISFPISTPFSDNINSAYCIDSASANSAKHFTWLSSSDSHGNSSIRGIGASTNSSLTSALANIIARDSFGLHKNGIITTSAGVSINLSTINCPALNIPHGAPVIITDLNIPEAAQTNVIKEEIRTSPCPADQSGHIIRSLEVTYLSDGRFQAAGQVYPASSSINDIPDISWILKANYCRNDLTLSSLNASEQTISALDTASLSALANPDNVVTNIIDESLSDVKCREATVVHASDQDTQGNTNNEEEGFSTCVGDTQLDALDSIGNTYVTIEEVEEVTQECGGGAETLQTSLFGHQGTLSYPAWSGEIVLMRNILRYHLDDELAQAANNAGRRNYRESWVGKSYSCSRQEQFFVSCEQPGAAGLTGAGDVPTTQHTLMRYVSTEHESDWYPGPTMILSDANASQRQETTTLEVNNGYYFDRTTNVNGWQDAEQFIPNAPQNTAWVARNIGEACRWTTRRQLSFNCPSGYSGSITKTFQRTYISSTLGSGSWQNWIEISSSGNCTDNSVSTGSGSGFGEAGTADADNDGDNEHSDSNDNDASVGAGDSGGSDGGDYGGGDGGSADGGTGGNR